MLNKPLILILISGLCGGSVYPLIKIAETYSIPKFSYIFWEALIIVTLLSAVALFKKKPALFKTRTVGYYTFCAITNIIIPQILFFTIASHLPANILSVITVLTPILVYTASIIFLKEKTYFNKSLGVIIGFLGILILFIPSILNDGYTISWYWLALALLVPMDYAINRIYTSKFIPKNDSPYSLTIGLFSLVAIISAILMTLSGSFYIPWQELNYGDLALLVHGILMAFFYLVFFVLAKECSLQNSMSLYLAPLVGISWGYLFFNEIFSLIFILASALVFGGLYLVTKK